MEREKLDWLEGKSVETNYQIRNYQREKESNAYNPTSHGKSVWT